MRSSYTPASRVACPAYMEQFARQAVGNIHHGCGLYAGAGECGDYVAAGFGFQLSFDKILLSVKFRYEVFFSGRCYFFAFEQLQAHVCRTEVAAYANKVGVLAPLRYTILSEGESPMHVTDIHETLTRRCSIAAYEVYSVCLTCCAQAVVKVHRYAQRRTGSRYRATRQSGGVCRSLRICR